jgi:hypothetical protein
VCVRVAFKGLPDEDVVGKVMGIVQDGKGDGWLCVRRYLSLTQLQAWEAARGLEPSDPESRLYRDFDKQWELAPDDETLPLWVKMTRVRYRVTLIHSSREDFKALLRRETAAAAQAGDLSRAEQALHGRVFYARPRRDHKDSLAVQAQAIMTAGSQEAEAKLMTSPSHALAASEGHRNGLQQSQLQQMRALLDTPVAPAARVALAVQDSKNPALHDRASVRLGLEAVPTLSKNERVAEAIRLEKKERLLEHPGLKKHTDEFGREFLVDDTTEEQKRQRLVEGLVQHHKDFPKPYGKNKEDGSRLGHDEGWHGHETK